MKKMKSDFEKRLLNYSINAGLLLAGASSINASIDVTTSNTTLTDGQNLLIDFDGGGLNEIDITNSNQGITHDFFNSVNGVNGNPFFLGENIAGGYFFPYALSENQSIMPSPATGIWGRRPDGQANDGTFTYNKTSGNWTNQSNRYLGVKFEIGANTHYGWVFMSIDSDNDEITIHSFAYETTPNTGISTPLPVELTSFSANQFENNVKLLWETATEVNNYGFDIEKQKLVASSHQSDWEKIGFVEGHGNSNSPKSYQFLDEANLVTGKYLYRLKQIDIDGKFEYTDAAEVYIGAPTNFALEQNYPNPFNPTTGIKFTLPENGLVNMSVYNTLGQEVAVLINQQMEAGNYEKEFDATGLPSGNYIYKLTLGKNFTSGKKLLLLK